MKKIKMKKIAIAFVLIIVAISVTAVLFLLLWPAFGKTPSKEDKLYYQSKADYWYDGIFHSKPEISILSGKESEFSGNEETVPKGTLPVEKLSGIPDAAEGEMKVVWFGHSSSMLQLQGKNILIDPVLSTYASPVAGFGSKRFSELPITAELLPEIDVLVISHDHYDHLDYKTIKAMDKKVKEYCVPLGVENHLIRWGVDEAKIHVMAWWDEVQIDGLKITSTPGQHYSWRVLWGKSTTLWSGYVFTNQKYQVYYTGDTGYGEFYSEIYEKLGDMDLLLLENGQYDNAWESIHMHPEQAIEAAKTVHAAWVIPVHWGAYTLANHPWDDSIRRMTSKGRAAGLNIATPKIGEIVDYNAIGRYQENWWEAIE